MSAPPASPRLDADPAGIAQAAALLRAGALVAFPTETVYGLGADATDPAAVAAIYEAKGRPSFNPLITHVAGLAAARREGAFDATAEALALAFWPGPLTLVVPCARSGRVCDLARAGLATIALRVPAHPVALGLLDSVGRPVAAPSANRSGMVSPTLAGHVGDDLAGRIAAVLDAGPTRIGLESTIVACLPEGPCLLRPGAITSGALAAVLGRSVPWAAPPQGEAAARPAAPGLLASHYAPRARVRLEAAEIGPGEAALLFGPTDPPGVREAVAVYRLSRSGNPVEAAARLYAGLRTLDASGADAIAVSPIPEEGLGEAINDRLRRAAAPR